MANEFVIYTEGFCYASICTSLTDEDALARMTPAGTERGWQIADEPFADGTPNRLPCPQQPDTHRHLLMDC